MSNNSLFLTQKKFLEESQHRPEALVHFALQRRNHHLQWRKLAVQTPNIHNMKLLHLKAIPGQLPSILEWWGKSYDMSSALRPAFLKVLTTSLWTTAFPSGVRCRPSLTDQYKNISNDYWCIRFGKKHRSLGKLFSSAYKTIQSSLSILQTKTLVLRIETNKVIDLLNLLANIHSWNPDKSMHDVNCIIIPFYKQQFETKIRNKWNNDLPTMQDKGHAKNLDFI